MPQLVGYVRQLREKGLSVQDIKEVCVSAGWSSRDVWQAIGEAYELPAPPPVSSTKNRSLGSINLWITFQYILLFISIYVMSISLGLLLITYIARWLPDPSVGYLYQDGTLATIRSCLAALLVSWPLFTLFFYQVKRKEVVDPHVRDLSSRKILIYLTLIVTFIVMTINLIMVLNALLDGSITSRFVANTAVILSIAGSIFWYYLGQVRQDRLAQSRQEA